MKIIQDALEARRIELAKLKAQLVAHESMRARVVASIQREMGAIEALEQALQEMTTAGPPSAEADPARALIEKQLGLQEVTH